MIESVLLFVKMLSYHQVLLNFTHWTLKCQILKKIIDKLQEFLFYGLIFVFQESVLNIFSIVPKHPLEDIEWCLQYSVK